MSKLMLVIAAALEIAFAVYCVRTRSYQWKARYIARLAAFATFVLLAALNVIVWSLRYYSLAAFLLVTAAVGGAGLLRNREDKRPYRTRGVVWRAISMISLIFVVLIPSMIFPQHIIVKPTGQYDVGVTYDTYTDTGRVEIYNNKGEYRKVTAGFWYPEGAAGKYPLVVFSHGSFGVKTSNETLYNELASHGYVVCAIDHTYQCFYTTDTSGRTTLINMGFMQEVQAEDAKADKQKSYADYQKWMAVRTGDINCAIDNIIGRARGSDPVGVYRLADTGKIGVMGHSLGGSAALGIGRMRDDIGAVVELDAPFMADIEGVKDGEFVYTDEPYPAPLLNVYSDALYPYIADWEQYAPAWSQYEENAALLAAKKPDVFNTHIGGVGHLGLTDLSLTSPFLTHLLDGGKAPAKDAKTCLTVLNKLCLDFFDCYLKGQGQFAVAGEF
jgi:dienelactone hydrolase/NADH:ubiquinone oxidoreductase subunit 6 (subunit J)